MKVAAQGTKTPRRTPFTATAAWLIGISLTMAVLTQTSVVWAEQGALDNALAAYGRGELDQALEGFEAALRQGGNSADQLVTIHVHLGVLRGAESDLESARRSFEIALVLNPMLSTPDELGGQLRSSFNDLRAARSGRRLMVEIRPEGSAAVEVVATNAPPGLVSTMRLRALDQRGVSELWGRSMSGSGPTTVALPPTLWQGSESSILSLVVDALDAHGNVLARGEEELQRPLEASASRDDVTGDGTEVSDGGAEGEGRSNGGQPEERRRRWEWYQHPALWVVVGLLVVGGVTTGVVLGTRDDDGGSYVLGAPQVR